MSLVCATSMRLTRLQANSIADLDRLVSACVGRPVSINEAVVTTEFPSLLDDRHITPSGFLLPPNQHELPSYKLVTHHYIRLRLLQSEILQVLQYRQADQARKLGANRDNPYVSKTLESQFMKPFSSYREWRSNIDGRLREWKDSAPQQSDTGVAFSPLFLELNYWYVVAQKLFTSHITCNNSMLTYIAY